jgi:hypothetical protein
LPFAHCLLLIAYSYYSLLPTYYSLFAYFLTFAPYDRYN